LYITFAYRYLNIIDLFVDSVLTSTDLVCTWRHILCILYTYFGDILEHNIKYYQNFINTALSATYSCSDTRVTTCQWFLHLHYWPQLISNFYIVRIYHSCCQNQKNQKRIYIAPCIPRIQRRLADGLSEVCAMIQISF